MKRGNLTEIHFFSGATPTVSSRVFLGLLANQKAKDRPRSEDSSAVLNISNYLPLRRDTVANWDVMNRSGDDASSAREVPSPHGVVCRRERRREVAAPPLGSHLLSLYDELNGLARRARRHIRCTL